MGVNDSADQSSQAASVAPTGSALLSLLYPYGNQPPRLIAALNDTITDCPPDGTLFGTYAASRKRSDEIRSKAPKGPKYPSAVGVVMANLPMPIAHVITLKDGDKALPSAPIPKHVQVPELVPQEKAPADAIGDILSWVIGRLATPWDTIWLSQMGPTLNWRTPDPEHTLDPAAMDAEAADEEAWARVVTQNLFAIDYAGSAELYKMGEVGKSVPPGQTWEQFVYRRIEPEGIVPQPWREHYTVTEKGKPITKIRVHGGHHVRSWIDPYWAPAEEKPSPTFKKEPNEDPAIPITGACQHCSTYLSLMRGYPLWWMGDMVNQAVGYQASNACARMVIFGADYSKHDPGPFGDAKDLVPPVPPGGAWIPGFSPPSVTRMLKPETAETEEERAVPPAVPGTVFVWDPDWDLEKDATIWMSWYESEYKYRATISKYLSTRSKVAGGDYDKSYHTRNTRVIPPEDVPDDAKVEKLLKQENDAIAAMTGLVERERRKQSPSEGQIKNWEAAKASAERRKKGLEAGKAKSTATDVETVYRRNAQLPGSHINAVLRVALDRSALQVFDTGIGNHIEILARTGSEAILPVNGGSSTVDGYRQPQSQVGENSGAVAQEDSSSQISSGTGKQYAGYGVPPPSPRKLSEMTAFLQTTRPVGLMRLALTRRVQALYNTNDILFVSTLRTMYGREDAERYPIAKLLWSLRNTPGFTNLQPWWLIYVPRGLLAKCMWAHKLPADEASAAGVPRMMMMEDFKAYFGQDKWQSDMDIVRYFQRYEPTQWPPKEGKDLDEARRSAAACKLYEGNHYMLVEAVTNHGSDSPAFAGKAHLFTRFRYEEGKQMPQMNGGYEWFKTLKNTSNKLSWDEMWLSPEIEKHRDAIAAKLPPFFPAPAAPPPPPPKPAGGKKG